MYFLGGPIHQRQGEGDLFLGGDLHLKMFQRITSEKNTDNLE